MKRSNERRHSWNDLFLGLGSALLILLINLSAVGQTDAAKLEFRGNRTFGESELRAVTEKCLVADVHWSETADSETLDYCLAQLRFFLYSKGYLQATVEKSLKKDRPEGLRVIITIAEGPLFRLGKVEVRGSKILSPDQLMQMLDVESGEIANGSMLDNWLHEKVRHKYSALGYVQFAYDVQPTFNRQPNQPEGSVDFAVMIDEGEVFTIASISFVGNGSVEAADLLRDLPLRNGEVFNRELFEQGLKRINQRGHFEPIDPDKDVEYKTDKARPQLHLTINLKRKASQ